MRLQPFFQLLPTPKLNRLGCTNQANDILRLCEQQHHCQYEREYQVPRTNDAAESPPSAERAVPPSPMDPTVKTAKNPAGMKSTSHFRAYIDGDALESVMFSERCSQKQRGVSSWVDFKRLLTTPTKPTKRDATSSHKVWLSSPQEGSRDVWGHRHCRRHRHKAHRRREGQQDQTNSRTGTIHIDVTKFLTRGAPLSGCTCRVCRIDLSHGQAQLLQLPFVS